MKESFSEWLEMVIWRKSVVRCEKERFLAKQKIKENKIAKRVRKAENDKLQSRIKD